MSHVQEGYKHVNNRPNGVQLKIPVAVEFDFIPKPKVARHELPWETMLKWHQPQRGCGEPFRCDTTPLGLEGSEHDDPE